MRPAPQRFAGVGGAAGSSLTKYGLHTGLDRAIEGVVRRICRDTALALGTSSSLAFVQPAYPTNAAWVVLARSRNVSGRIFPRLDMLVRSFMLNWQRVQIVLA